MGMRRPLVAGNWKMNGSRTESAALLEGVKKGMSSASKVEVAVCPPYVLIPLAAEKLAGSVIA
ncbi:MAG: triose-phosphate isomerase, partial [Sulfuricaulis sp.]|nr:triose-phosphate isomerase [Sulfuricaulis sp.]